MNSYCKNTLFDIYKHLDEKSKPIMRNIINCADDINSIRDNIIFPVKDKEDHSANEQVVEILPEKDYKIADLRIKYVTFDNFRTFPHNDPPFGLSLLNNNKICSGFFIASNGVGKTSIFSGIEKYYTGKISAEESFQIRREEKQNYETFGFNAISEDNNSVKFPNKANYVINVELANPLEKEVSSEYGEMLSPFFISDYDVTTLLQSNLTDFVLSQLGLGDLVLIYKKLGRIGATFTKKLSGGLSKSEIINLASYVMENINDQEWVDDILKIDNMSSEAVDFFWLSDKVPKKVLTKIRNSLYEEKSMPERRIPSPGDPASGTTVAYYEKSYSNASELLSLAFNTMREWVQQYKPDKDKININPPERLIKDWIASVDSASDNDYSPNTIRHILKSQEILNKIIYAFDEKITNIKKEFVSKSDSLIVNTLQKFSDEETEHISFDFKDEKITTSLIVDYGKTGFPTTPQMYFNTFRFKLYAVALKVALAFRVMEENNLVAPIVIDDVFSASDFDNSIKLSEFVIMIYDTYAEKFKDRESLQIILLTHDDGIQHTFAKYADSPCIAKRIFSYKDVINGKDAISKDGNFINLCL